MFAYIVGGWTFLLALGLAAAAGYFHLPWYVPALCVLGGLLGREAATNFQMLHMSRTHGAGFAVRAAIMTVLFFGAFWAAGYGLSLIFR